MSYQIDGNTVTGFNWRQRKLIGNMTDQRIETLPGSGHRYLTVGEAMPHGVEITGDLTAASIAALDALLATEAARRDSTATSPVTVSLSSVSHDDQVLVGFEVLGREYLPYAGNGTTGVMIKVRYTWQGVTPGGSA